MPETKFRDAVTGEYVTEAYALENPDTTVAEEFDAAPVQDDKPGEVEVDE